LARHLKAFEGIDVSHNFIAQLWREAAGRHCGATVCSCEPFDLS
jgi:hypothetical protein